MSENVNSRFGFIPVVSILGNEKKVSRLAMEYAAAFKGIGGEQWPAERADHRAPLFFFVVTGGTERKILDLWQKRRKAVTGEPIFLVAHPGNNSLPAALEVLARLQQEGASGRIFYLDSPEDAAGGAQLTGALRDLATYRRLRQARIGLIDAPSDWLVASSPTPATVRETWGPEVEPIPMDALYEAMGAASADEIHAIADELANSAGEVREPSRAELEDGARVYLGLRQIVEQHRLSALTLRCFDLVIRSQVTGCFALAQLNDEGVIAGCEGDVVSTLGMLWASYLLGQIPWMANPARLSEAHNKLWLAHCTVPRRLTCRYRLRSHFESGLGMALQGEIPPGPVTLLRVGGAALRQVWLAEGDLLRSGEAENLCRTQVEIRLTQGNVSDLLRAPLGNHLILVRGHHADRLRSWREAMLRPQV